MRRALGTRLTWQVDGLWMVLFGLLAAGLFLSHLGGLALRDWDEGIAAQVARQIWRGWEMGTQPWAWLFPQYVDGSPYVNKPPLMHWLMAVSYGLFGINEWSSRLPGALLTALSVPLFYWMSREVFYDRAPSVLATGVYLTSIPLVRLGRLAMLDGGMMFWMVVMWGALLRSRRDQRWLLLWGMAIGMMCLTKGLMGVLIAGLGVVFLIWDTPRLVVAPYLWCGLWLGLCPTLAWYGAQYWRYGLMFLQQHFLDQSIDRLWKPVERNGQPVWYYAVELLKYGAPWLLFWPLGAKRVWQGRELSLGKLVMVWGGGYGLVISLMGTKLPWYGLPLFGPLALMAGEALALLWHRSYPEKQPWRVWGSIFWVIGSIAFVGSVAIGPGMFGYRVLGVDSSVSWVLLALGGSFGVAGILATARDRMMIPVLIWGMYVSLGLLVTIGPWVWELGEDYPVKPVAELVRRHTPTGIGIYTTHPVTRPSLDFYADRRVARLEESKTPDQYLKSDPQPYLLVHDYEVATIGGKVVARVPGWAIMTRRD